MRTLIASIAVVLLAGCGDTGGPTAIATPTPIYVVVTATPSPTPLLAYTPVTNPTPHRIVPTVTYKRPEGLGISRYELQSFAEQWLGYKFGSEQNDRVVGLRGSVSVVLVNPVEDLSKVHMLIPIPSDAEAVLDLTAIAISIGGSLDASLGDLEWIFDGFIAGNRKVSKDYGPVRVIGEVLGIHTIAITFEAP